MNKVILGFKREFWEYRRTVIIVPLILSVLIILASAMAALHGSSDHQESLVEAPQVEISSRHKSNLTPAEGDIQMSLNAVQQRAQIRFTSIYIALSWMVALVYLLSSLYRDRRDNSVLYWKSLPVSETQTVLTKFVFGGVAIAFISLLIAWVVYLLLSILGWGAIDSLGGGDGWRLIDRTFNPSRLFLWSSMSVVIGLLWGAPYFAFALLVSSLAKRVPFLLWIIAPLVVAALEKIFFSSTHLVNFYTSHFPFVVLIQLSESPSLGVMLSTFFIDQGAQMLLGLLVSAMFLSAAVWSRNYRFELNN